MDLHQKDKFLILSLIYKWFFSIEFIAVALTVNNQTF